MKLKKAIIHAHHMSTHFTNGLFPVSAVLLTLYLVFPDPSYEAASFYCLVFGTLSIPIVYGTGFYDWRTRFKGRHTMIFDHKSILGVVFFILTLIVIYLRVTDDVMNGVFLWKWIYVGLNYVITLLTVYLGYLGGKFI